jgi:hypothetical protein
MKIAVFAPIPTPRVTTGTAVKLGFFPRLARSATTENRKIRNA